MITAKTKARAALYDAKYRIIDTMTVDQVLRWNTAGSPCRGKIAERARLNGYRLGTHLIPDGILLIRIA
jgi:hypothetical protein